MLSQQADEKIGRARRGLEKAHETLPGKARENAGRERLNQRKRGSREKKKTILNHSTRLESCGPEKERGNGKLGRKDRAGSGKMGGVGRFFCLPLIPSRDLPKATNENDGWRRPRVNIRKKAVKKNCFEDVFINPGKK